MTKEVNFAEKGLMLDFTAQLRKEVMTKLLERLEEYFSETKAEKVSREWNISNIKSYARAKSFDVPTSPYEALDHVLKGLTDYAVHTTHPNYFGLFNPRASYASILGDLITATFNPQLAAWSHAPFANEVERFVIEEFGKKFGYSEDQIDGTFCSGGAESNLTAVICAINHFFPNVDKEGIQGIDSKPIIYCSSESHHSIEKSG